MNSDPLEQRLTRQLLQGPPSAWKADILQIAQQSLSPQPARCLRRAQWFAWLRLEPSPGGWLVLTGAWVVMLALTVGQSTVGRVPVPKGRLQADGSAVSTFVQRKEILDEILRASTPPASSPQPVPTPLSPPQAGYRGNPVFA